MMMPIDDTGAMSLNDVLKLHQKPAMVQYLDPDRSGVEKLSTVLLSAKSVGEKARAQAIAESGMSIGIKTGITWQIGVLTTAIKQRERDLDTIYDFSRFMIHDRVVPPIITEARDLYNQAGNYELRLSGAYYKIEYQARFTSTAPNWRDYFNFAKPTLDPELLQKTIAPRGEYEDKVWQLAVQQGWNQGVEQANLMVKNSFDRLNRDIVGMIRFHTFVNQGKISMPAIATESIAVTQMGQTMAVDETLLKLTTLPQFNGKMAAWSSTLLIAPTTSQVIRDSEK